MRHLSIDQESGLYMVTRKSSTRAALDADEGREKSGGQPLVTGLLRGLAVLRCFDHGRERLGSSEIARMTGLPQPTVWRLCKTLEHGGYLTADPDGSRFRPGLSILTLGYSALEAELANGNMLLAIINIDLLGWDSKASHPWILNVEIKYDGVNGMPDDETYQLLGQIEEEIMEALKDIDGYLNIGRQTADGVREIYFACKDFRLPSKTAYIVQQKYSGRVEINYDIYKDKYWRSFDHFVN